MTGHYLDDSSIFDRDLERGPANHVPLSPLGFLRRSAMVYPGKTAVIHGERRIGLPNSTTAAAAWRRRW
jgi:hypothetical protein